MRIMTFNMNGIRSSRKKGFFEWFQTQDIDVLCIQETKAQLSDFEEEDFQVPGYTRIHADAQKKGYSGVAIYSRRPPISYVCEVGLDQADQEGRFAQMDFETFSVVSLYLPSGAAGPHRQKAKFEFLDFWGPWMQREIQKDRPLLICGDWNIVHQEIDIRNFKSNQKNSGCLPEERAWLDHLIKKQGWIDCFRVINPEPHQYTWWSNRGNARENNVGWRIDYQLGTPHFKSLVKGAEIYKDQWFSDHAPLTVEYEMEGLI